MNHIIKEMYISYFLGREGYPVNKLYWEIYNKYGVACFNKNGLLFLYCRLLMFG